MKSRAIFLSTPKRITQTEQYYKVNLNPLWLNQYIFELSGLNEKQTAVINQFSKNVYPVFDVVTTALSGIVLVKAHNLINNFQLTINNYLNDSPMLKSFFSRTLDFYLNNSKPKWRIGGRVLDFNKAPFIMGILNVTPDSFSDGGKFIEKEKAVEHGLMMIGQGADIIDIGGESTRPGSDPVSLDDEIKRVTPVIEGIRNHTNALISIDTYKSQTAKAALEAGADIINDISGCLFDPQMIDTAKTYNCPLIIMHIKGAPKDMQKNPVYENVSAELYRYFEERIAELGESGLDKIIIDPGIGFGKRLNDNLNLIRDLKDFLFLGKPVLIGTSRKSFIGQILNKETDKRLSGSLASLIISIENGADIVRVHDIAETKDAVNIYRGVKNWSVGRME